MISISNKPLPIKKKARLQILIQSMMNRHLASAMSCSIFTALGFQSPVVQAATIYFETDFIEVSEPQTGNRRVSVRPIVTFGAYNNTDSSDGNAWAFMETTSSSCTISGSISANTAGSTATLGTDYRAIEDGAFSLSTTPYRDESEQIRFDDVSQEVLFEIMADDIEEDEEQIQFEFSNLSISCAEGFFNLNSTNYGSTTVSITPTEPEPSPSGPRPIPPRQKSLATQFENIRSLSLQTAANRARSLSRELNNARMQSGFSRSNLQVSIDGTPLPLPAVSGSGAGDAFDDFGRWGFFLTGTIDIGTRKESGSTSLDYDSSLLIAGIDYRASDNLVVGSAISMTIADMGSRPFVKTDFNSSTLSLFGSYYSDETFYVDAIFTSGLNDYDLVRSIETTGAINDTARAKTEGDETAFSVGAGYNFSDRNRNFRLFTLFNYLDVNVDAYNESVSGTSSAASINDINLQSLTADVGFEASWNINTLTGVYTPLMSIAMVHQYKDDAVDINGRFIGGQDQGGFYFQGAERDSNYLTAQLGLSGVFKNGLNAYLTYDTDLARKDLSSKRYSAGVRWQY